MRMLKICPVALVLFVLTSCLAYGQATRTWVSGVGDDANPCSRTAPCKTFAGAISKTAPGGEIDALDPGGFGALTITKSITLDGGGGQVASVLVSGTNGIVVAAGSTDVVIIRNLRFDGLLGNCTSSCTNAGINGIRFISGKTLILENDVIFGFNNNGVDIANNQTSTVVIKDTYVANCLAVGVRAQTSSGTVGVTIDNSSFEANGFGVWADNASKVTVTRSVAGGNSAIGFIAQATTAGQTGTLSLSEDVSANNGIGMQAGGGAGTSVLNYNRMTVFNNSTGLVNGGNGTSHSFGNSSNTDGGTANGTALSPTN